ncbi:hypothetical protein AGMMS49942_29810 [Spirochaetia bacterium]|nr:hypothetical protein AGMMS49942_29810 [Spirochaetia bacterium]
MKRINHGLIVGLAVLLLAAVSFVGCENPEAADGLPGAKGDTGDTGGQGIQGSKGPIYLGGTVSSAGIQAAIDSGVPLTFAGVEQGDAGLVIIPAGRSVSLVGPAAFSTGASGILVITAASSVTGTGTIIGSGVVVTPASVNNTIAGRVDIVESAAVVTGAPTGNVAYRGNRKFVSSATVTAGEITAPTGGNIFILGDLDTTAASSGGNVFVLGNFTTSVNGSAAIGGTLSVKGNATFTGLAGEVTGKATIGGKLDAQGTTSFTATGGVDVGGAAIFAGTYVQGAAPSTFNGTVSFAKAVSRTSGAFTFNGDVTLSTAATITLTSTGNLTLKAGKSIKVGTDTVLRAGVADVTIEPTAGAVLAPTTKKITVGTANIKISGDLIVADGATLAATQGSTVGDIALASTATITTVGTGKVEIGAVYFLSGAGKFTNTGDVLTFASTNGTTGTITGTGATVLKLTGAAVLTINAAATTGVTVSTATIDVSDSAGTQKVSLVKNGVFKLNNANGKLKSANVATGGSSASTLTVNAGVDGPIDFVKGVTYTISTSSGSSLGVTGLDCATAVTVGSS